MTFKDKLILIILSIITLGIYPIVLFKKKNHSVKDELSTSKVVTDIKKLQEFLGGKDNVVGTEYSHTKIKIYVKDKTKVNIENIQSLKGISGVFASSKSVTIIVGKQAKDLAAQL